MVTFRLEERLSYRCSIISNRIARFITPMLEEAFQLTLITWRVLAVIGRYEPMSSKDVALHTSTDAFFVSRAVEQLVQRGYVSRTPDDQDRRRVSLALTDRGRAVHHQVEDTINRIEEAIVADLPEPEQTAMRTALARLDERSAALVHSGAKWQDFFNQEAM